MNRNHAELCSSREWAEHLQANVLTPLFDGLDPVPSMIEIGPGPGAATDWLRHRVEKLTAIEADPQAAAVLQTRYAGTNVEIVTGDASALSFGDGTFDAAASFTMLHHVPTAAQQDAVLAEAVRVLRPGGVLVGSDSLASDGLREFHEGDTYNPIPPSHLLAHLQALGCARITVDIGEIMTFVARKPSA